MDPKHPSAKPTLVQTKLTSAFFGPANSSRHSPYFTRPSRPSSTNTSAATSSNNDNGAASSSSPTQSTPAYGAPPSPPLQHRPPWEIPASLRLRSKLLRPSNLHRTKTSGALSVIATETKLLLPSLLADAPHAPPTGLLFHPYNLEPLRPSTCPQLPSTKIEVLNADSIDTALSLSPTPSPSTSDFDSTSPPTPPVLILNMANAAHGGGGWLKGALAQEETLCYRTSLSFTLKRHFYPIADHAAIYSPSVIVLRQSIAAGHDLLDLTRPRELPVVSIVSMPAVRNPPLEGDQGEFGRYQDPETRALMKEKMRVVLRVAARHGHRVLVLGALGCGAFGNPRGEVVACWKEVLVEEEEFRGGWWEKVVFAVMEAGGEKEGEGNFGVFWRGLDGVEV